MSRLQEMRRNILFIIVIAIGIIFITDLEDVTDPFIPEEPIIIP